MKLSKTTKILLVVQLLLFIFICCTPSKKQLASTVGLWGPYILWNRIRDFAAIPISIANFVLLLCSVLSVWSKRKFCFSARFRRPLLVLCAFMAMTCLYWTIGVIRMEQFPLMPAPVWTYLLHHPYVFSLWWAAAGVFCFLCKRKTPPDLESVEL